MSYYVYVYGHERFSRHYLHAAVVHDDRLELDVGVELADLLARLEEQPVAELHDVGLVDRRHLPPAVPGGVVEGELGDPQRVLCRDHLQRLHHARDGLVLQGRVLALGRLADDRQVDS